MRYLVLFGFLLLTLVGGVTYGLWGTISLYFFDRTVESTMTGDRLETLEDGLHVAVCGGQTAMTDPSRSGPCLAVIAGRRLFLIDTGAGSVRLIKSMGWPIGDVKAVLLTNVHSDHFDGLGQVIMKRWLSSNALAPLTVRGPAGIEEVVNGLNIAYAPEARYRTAHHGRDIAHPSGAGGVALPFQVPEDGQYVVVLAEDDLQISAFRVAQAQGAPGAGYRFDYKGRSLVISGDSASSVNLQHFAKGADLLIHDAVSPALLGRLTTAARASDRHHFVKISKDIVDHHATPLEAADTAKIAGVRHLMLYHILPSLPAGGLDRILIQGVPRRFSGDITIGRAGTFVSLPAGTQEVKVDHLL